MKKVAVGLSGGVDSAVSAALLVEQGFDVTGVFLECWRGPGCRVDEDRKDAMDVAMKLNIPFKVLDFKDEYKKKVVDYFYREYEAGRTPNPDTMCNREIKFGMFYEWALSHQFDFVATGHYARIGECSMINDQLSKNNQLLNDQNKLCLMRGADERKDQSYFLYQLRQDQLDHILFPVGEMTKKEVRDKAKELGLPVAEKPDSQGICFIGPVSTREFLKDLGMKEKTGDVVLDDLVVGQHKGAWFYTIGQRYGWPKQATINNKQETKIRREYIRNLRRLGFDPSNLPPLYVVSKDVEKNELVVGKREDLMRDEFEVGDIHFVNEDARGMMQEARDLRVRIRHGGALVSARCKMQDDRCMIRLEEPLFGVAEGQAAVFYRGDEVLGGGVIS